MRKFQDGADLKATGVLDDRTVKAINSPKRDRAIDTVIVNMERWRWLPRQLGAPTLNNAYVILNVPDYTLRVMQNGAPVWTTRVVTGKPGNHATPLLTETMKFITVNPTWNVPPSIIYNEYLPALQQDPTVLQRMGLRLERNRDGSIHISQPPGEGNALGRIRFNFPNKFLVYQHDTPDKHLFAKEERAFSHGCMRVQNPDQYAATLLGIVLPNERYTPEKIRSMYGRSEIDIKFPTPIPVNITYQTAFVDDAGKLQLRKDVYGRDAAMQAILRGAKGKDLESVMARSQPGYSRPAGSQPALERRVQQRLRQLRTVVLRSAVRAADAAAAAGSGTASAPGRSPLSVVAAGLNFDSVFQGLHHREALVRSTWLTRINHCPPGFRQRALFRHTRG